MFSTEINKEVLDITVKRCQEKGVIIPTFAQMKNPALIPEKIKEKLKNIGLWEVNPLNLFRISWKNEPKTKGGLFNNGNYIEFPQALTGVKARIVGVIGKWFPTGAHKVGAGFGCLVPRLVTGQFDPIKQRAVWPSTGNYCRGGAFDCALLGCDAIAILPQDMSKERFEWLKEIGTKEIFATPGCESNVKEIYDKCWELRRERGKDVIILNQFEEFGNSLWHYHVTASNMEDIFNQIKTPKSRLSAYVSATGSAGTISAGDYLKKVSPHCKVVATESIQCPTLLNNGFGGHRIEGIGDKHVPWVHNVRNTDVVSAIDDEQCMCLMRLFNEKVGQKFLKEQVKMKDEDIEKLPTCGISSICNLVAAIKTAKYYEMNEDDVIFLPLTDSMAMYGSRMEEQTAEKGPYTEMCAMHDWAMYLHGIVPDHLKELNYQDRKALHNLKYFTWVEQQGKTVEELNKLWEPEFWEQIWGQDKLLDKLIEEFNKKTGCLEKL